MRVTRLKKKKMDYLDELENEAIYILREVAAQFDKPVLLFSGGKDSITLVHLAIKAFYPAPVPFPLMHVDTGHNFPETITFRDELVKEYGLNLYVEYVQDAIDAKLVSEETGKYASRNALQTVSLLNGIEKHGFNACIGGARRDEEKARAKERIFSVRDDFGQWNAKNQRPELFDILNGRIEQGENVRAFPISNWTELDVWNYLKREKIEIPSVYYANSFKRSMMFSESLEDKPEVGSSTKRTEGSRISSKAIFNLFLCPPEIVFSKGDPTFKSFVSYKPKEESVFKTRFAISLSSMFPKHNFAL